MRRYGIFGGTFNPPHIGHSIFAENVREQLHLDKIIFIPSGNPPLKKGIEIIDAKHRLRMAEIAFEKDEISKSVISRLKTLPKNHIQ